MLLYNVNMFMGEILFKECLWKLYHTFGIKALLYLRFNQISSLKPSLSTFHFQTLISTFSSTQVKGFVQSTP